MILLVFFSFSSLVVSEQERPQRHKFSFVGDKDYFYNCRTLPLMRLTQKWIRKETLYSVMLAWHDGFSPIGQSQKNLPSLHRGISTVSSCTSLHFTAVGSLNGPAAPIASLLMDLCMEFRCVLMHMMHSYMSHWAVDHKATRTFWCGGYKKEQEMVYGKYFGADLLTLFLDWII